MWFFGSNSDLITTPAYTSHIVAAAVVGAAVVPAAVAVVVAPKRVWRQLALARQMLAFAAG